ncbi:Dynamin [Penicillium frequentans]|uniref:Dynamin n=1 Tax=Penicillium frequentans TaxID=3151616 RepID=A0AAD6GES5_9EURO|nr:Dynamin [Penicillium glabrum]
MLADPILLEKIDKLFACNVGEYISLPHLVVVGDQSSGKSSVLEGLTKLSFPRDSGLCTRFATQIIFRRNASLVDRVISASMIPEPGVDSQQEQKLRSWKAEGVQTLSKEGFSEMMKEVHHVMDLSTSIGDGKATFSRNILCLEICGPRENHLSVIDVPGIFKNTTSGRTTKSDIDLVRNMVDQYMRNPRSIMLTVVPANVDIATQEIIEMAREVDSTGDRTLRILTKPDLVDKGAESKIVALFEEGNLQGQLGWVLVRNLGQQQLDDGTVDRDNEEELFHRQVPWNNVSNENYGIGSLRTRLREILTSAVRRAFPDVRFEVSKKLKESRDTLRLLGFERETPEQQRRLLIDIVSEFQKITQHALCTNYGAYDIFDKQEARLATLIANRNAQFSCEMSEFGHEYAFKTECPAPAQDGSPAPIAEEIFQSKSDSSDIKEGNSPGFMESRKFPDLEQLNEILCENLEIEYPSTSGIERWIETIHHSAKGFEIGTFNHTLLTTLMKRQSSKWPMIAHGYISDIIIIIHNFIERVLEAAFVDQSIPPNIIALLTDDLMSKYRESISQVNFLLKIEREGTPMTLNSYLSDSLQKCRQDRVQSNMAPLSTFAPKLGLVVRLTDLTAKSPQDNDKRTAQDIHDILQSYYTVACRRFVDSVCMQAADHRLVTGPEAPMSLFSALWVDGLSTEELEEIAGEDMKIRRKRRQLQAEIEGLEAGRKVLSRG